MVISTVFIGLIFDLKFNRRSATKEPIDLGQIPNLLMLLCLHLQKGDLLESLPHNVARSEHDKPCKALHIGLGLE